MEEYADKIYERTFCSIPEELLVPLINDLSPKKILVLDFDGVLNPFSKEGTFKKQYYDAKKRFLAPNPHYNETQHRLSKRSGMLWYPEPKNYPISYSEELIEDLNKLFEELGEDLSIVWLTTWRQDVLPLVEKMGIKLPKHTYVLNWDGNSFEDKLWALENWKKFDRLEDLRTIVHIDDDGFKKVPGTLQITPDCRYGISRNDFEKLSMLLGR